VAEVEELQTGLLELADKALLAEMAQQIAQLIQTLVEVEVLLLSVLMLQAELVVMGVLVLRHQ
jgi:hypothetical protein